MRLGNCYTPSTGKHYACRKTTNKTTTMQAPYIPSKDADYALWLANFAALIAATPVAYGLIAGDATVISASNTAFQTAYALAITPETRTSATIAEKDAQRAAATATVRPYAVSISRDPSVSDELKIGVGVNLPNSSRTPIPAPTTAPALTHTGSTHLNAGLAYRDVTTPTTKGKPPGVVTMELRSSIGLAVSTDPDSALTRGLYAKSPLGIGFQADEVGKIVTLWGRWLTKSGPAGVSQPGPWSAPLSFGVI